MNLKVKAKLDPKFEPLSVVVREMKEATKENGQDIIVAVERNKGYGHARGIAVSGGAVFCVMLLLPEFQKTICIIVIVWSSV